MPQYDGSIKIDTKIDTKNVSSQMLRLQNQISKASRKASNLTQKMREMEKQRIPTEEYKNISDALQRSTHQFDKLLQRQQEMISRGKTSGQVWDSLDKKIEEVGADIRAAQKYQSQMVSEGTAYLSMDAIQSTDAYKRLSDQLRDTNDQMKTLSKRHEELTQKEYNTSNTANKARKTTGDWLDEFSRKTKKTSGLLGTLASRFKGIALSLLVFNWITKGWNAMISAVKSGTNNMAKYSSELNGDLSKLSGSCETLKNAFGSLASPIIHAATPALLQLIDVVTTAVNKVNQLIAILSGKTTWTKATTQVKDYAAGIESASGAAKSLNKQLQSFNELNVINSDSGSGSGGSSGSSASDMFEEVPIDSSMKGIADEIKKAVESGDWEGLGEYINNKIASALKQIDWDKAYSGADKFGSGLASFLNGLISPELFGEVGDTIASALNTAVYLALAFGKEFDFEEFGESIAEGINHFFDTFDFDALADTLNTWVDGLEDAIIAFINTVEWEDIVDKAEDFLGDLELDTVTILIGAFLLKHKGKELTKAILNSEVGKKILENGKLLVSAAAITFVITEVSFSLARSLSKSFFEWYNEKYGTNYDTSKIDELSNWDIVVSGFKLSFNENGKFQILGLENLKKLFPENEFVNTLYGILNGSVLKAFQNLSWDDFWDVFLHGLTSDKVGELWTDLENKWNKIPNKVTDFKVRITSKASDLWTQFKTNWNSGKSKTADFKLQILSKAVELWNNFKKDWGDYRKTLFKTGISKETTASKLWNAFKTSWGTSKNVTIGIGFPKNALKNLWDSITSFFSGKSVSVGASGTKKANGGVYTGGIWHDITHYAVGTSNAPVGQMFIAREAGPELVGTLGGHTAVMNNDQIVASVSDGVYRAVRSAMGSGNKQLNVTFKVEGDPNGIFRVVRQEEQKYFDDTGNLAFVH